MTKRYPHDVGIAKLARTILARMTLVFRPRQQAESSRHGWLFSLLLMPQIAFAHGAESLGSIYIGVSIAAMVAAVIVLAFIKVPMLAKVLLFFPLSFAFGFGIFIVTIYFLYHLAKP